MILVEVGDFTRLVPRRYVDHVIIDPGVPSKAERCGTQAPEPLPELISDLFFDSKDDLLSDPLERVGLEPPNELLDLG